MVTKMSLDKILINLGIKEKKYVNWVYSSQGFIEENRSSDYHKKNKKTLSKVILTCLLIGSIGTGAITYARATQKNEQMHLQRNLINNNKNTHNHSITKKSKKINYRWCCRRLYLFS